MDKLSWFKFTVSDWMMGKIMKCPEVTQARFVRLCCLYWNKECELTIEDAEIEIDKDHLDILSSKKVVKKHGAHILITFLDEQVVGISETSKLRKAAADERWRRIREINASASNNNASALQNDAEKSRVEKEKSRVEYIPVESTGKSLKKTKPVTADSPLYTRMVDVWFKEIHPDWVFSKIDGSKMKAIIEKIKERFKKTDRSDTDNEIVDFFRKMCKNLPEFHKNKELKDIESNFNSIIELIKNPNKLTTEAPKPVYTEAPKPIDHSKR